MDRERAFDCVVAADAAGGMGKDNDLPWPRLTEDLRFLRRITSEAAPGQVNAVIMGRLTWGSVPSQAQPLAGRLNIVVSRQELALPPRVLLAHSLDDALDRAHSPSRAVPSHPAVDRILVIGGAQIFQSAFGHPLCRWIYLTRIHATFACDTFLPPLAPRFELAEILARHREHDLDFEIQRWARAGSPDGDGDGDATADVRRGV